MTDLTPHTRRQTGLLEFLHDRSFNDAKNSSHTTPVMAWLQVASGIVVEACLLFEEPNDALDETMRRLSETLSTHASDEDIPAHLMPHPYDFDILFEKGRDIARESFEEWLDDGYQYHDVALHLLRGVLTYLEENGIPMPESLKAFETFASNGMILELAAQELCDIVIEQKMGRGG